MESIKVESRNYDDDNNNMKRHHHAVCIPYPAQGHISPMLKLAKLLHATKHFHISFLNTDHNHRRLLRSHGPVAVSGLPSFRFHSFPDGLSPAAYPDATQDMSALCTSLFETGPATLRDLLSRLNSEGGDAPPVSCVVADAGVWFAIGVAEELGLPAAMFWTASACSLLGFAHFERLIQIGILPLPDSSCLTNGYLDKVVEGIPMMEGICLKDLPGYLRTTDANNYTVNYAIRRSHFITTSHCPIIFNTFQSLEGSTLQALASAKIINSPILPIGPLSLLQPATKHQDLDHSSIRSSLLPEDVGCLSWLDTKPPNSVVYVNFGSVTILTRDQVTELALGLVNSMQNFLWVIRPDIVSKLGSTAETTRQLVDGTQGRGMLASWCDQEGVLVHSAVGGFITHCGWNSTMEAITHGVPMICWPFYSDQMTNCWFSNEKWGVGAEIGGGEVKREEVERVVRAVVEGDKGKELRRKAKEWKRLGEEAVEGPNGSSYLYFYTLVNHLIGA